MGGIFVDCKMIKIEGAGLTEENGIGQGDPHPPLRGPPFPQGEGNRGVKNGVGKFNSAGVHDPRSLSEAMLTYWGSKGEKHTA